MFSRPRPTAADPLFILQGDNVTLSCSLRHKLGNVTFSWSKAVGLGELRPIHGGDPERVYNYCLGLSVLFIPRAEVSFCDISQHSSPEEYPVYCHQFFISCLFLLMHLKLMMLYNMVFSIGVPFYMRVPAHVCICMYSVYMSNMMNPVLLCAPRRHDTSAKSTAECFLAESRRTCVPFRLGP